MKLYEQYLQELNAKTTAMNTAIYVPPVAGGTLLYLYLRKREKDEIAQICYKKCSKLKGTEKLKCNSKCNKEFFNRIKNNLRKKE